VARVRLVCVLALAALCVSAGAFGASAFGARSHGRAAKRCRGAARAGANHTRRASRSRRHGRAACAKHHTTARGGLSGGSTKHALTTHGRAKSLHPVNRSCANAGLHPTEHNLSLIRAATLCLVNRERSSHGERPLTENGRLEQTAQSHTESMVRDDYFEHVGPHGETPLQRMRAVGYISSSHVGYQVGENIGWGTLWLGTPRAIVAAWMASPGHRANILDASYRETGIGVSSHPPSSLANHQPGGIYTEDFGAIVGG
jgi:uncharacterized protein YkwD